MIDQFKKAFDNLLSNKYLFSSNFDKNFIVSNQYLNVQKYQIIDIFVGRNLRTKQV